MKGDASGSTVRIPLAGTPLASVGGVARIVSNAGSILVTRLAATEFAVFSATCSHESCLISDGDAEAFICPCHGSKFDRRGAVLVGPAELPLYPFAYALDGDILTITVS